MVRLAGKMIQRSGNRKRKTLRSRGLARKHAPARKRTLLSRKKDRRRRLAAVSKQRASRRAAASATGSSAKSRLRKKKSAPVALPAAYGAEGPNLPPGEQEAQSLQIDPGAADVHGHPETPELPADPGTAELQADSGAPVLQPSSDEPALHADPGSAEHRADPNPVVVPIPQEIRNVQAPPVAQNLSTVQGPITIAASSVDQDRFGSLLLKTSDVVRDFEISVTVGAKQKVKLDAFITVGALSPEGMTSAYVSMQLSRSDIGHLTGGSSGFSGGTPINTWYGTPSISWIDTPAPGKYVYRLSVSVSISPAAAMNSIDLGARGFTALVYESAS
jgi:hypothetical protein